MAGLEHDLLHYFLRLQSLTDENLSVFYKESFIEYILEHNDLTINGVAVSHAKRRELLGTFRASQFNTGSDKIIALSENDILETCGIIISEETFIERVLSQLPENTAFIRRAKLVEKVKAYKGFLVSKLIELEKDKKSKTLSHRLNALIYKYKADASCVPNIFNRSEIREQGGKGLEKAFDTIWNSKGAAYRKPTEKELTIIIPYLFDCPSAEKAAINDLDKFKFNL